MDPIKGFFTVETDYLGIFTTRDFLRKVSSSLLIIAVLYFVTGIRAMFEHFLRVFSFK